MLDQVMLRNPGHLPAAHTCDWPVVAEGELHVGFAYTGASVVLGLQGPLEGRTVAVLDAALDLALEQRPERVVVYAGAVTACCARALAKLAAAAERAADQGCTLSVVGLAPVHERLFRRCWPRVASAEGLPGSLAAALPPVEERSGADLAAEAAQLRRSLALRADLERALGVVMADNGCSAGVAFATLAEAASRAGITVGRIAAAVVTVARSA